MLIAKPSDLGSFVASVDEIHQNLTDLLYIDKFILNIYPSATLD